MGQASVFLSLSLLVLLCATVHTEAAQADKAGLKPLGYGITPVDTLSFSHWPTPDDLKHKLVETPFVVRNGGKSWPAVGKWDYDFITKSNIYSEYEKSIDEVKADHSDAGSIGQISDVIKYFETQKPGYITGPIFHHFIEDLLLPDSIRCTRNLDMVFKWISTAATSSFLHSDQAGNIHCLLAGTQKRFLLIDKFFKHVYDSPIRPSVSRVDPNAVDLEQFPEFSDFPYHEINLDVGDCLYIPRFWAHQVKAAQPDKGTVNIGVNFWFLPESLLDEKVCTPVNMKNVTISMNHGIRSYWGSLRTCMFKNSTPKRGAHLSECVEASSLRLQVDVPAIVKELDTNSDGKLSVTEWDAVNIMSACETSPVIFEFCNECQESFISPPDEKAFHEVKEHMFPNEDNHYEDHPEDSQGEDHEYGDDHENGYFQDEEEGYEDQKHTEL